MAPIYEYDDPEYDDAEREKQLEERLSKIGSTDT